MSAWICSEEHIGALARAYVARVNERADFGAVFKVLALENARSINARYGDTEKGIPATKAMADYPEIDGAVLGKQVSCYNYQACEHEGWGRSDARLYMLELGFSLYTEGLYRTPEWESAPWGLD